MPLVAQPLTLPMSLQLEVCMKAFGRHKTAVCEEELEFEDWGCKLEALDLHGIMCDAAFHKAYCKHRCNETCNYI